MKVLVLAAHPDDEVLGCGGTIAFMARQGYDVSIAVLGEGATSRYTKREASNLDETMLLGRQCEKAANMLGANKVTMAGLPDNRFDSLDLLDVVKIVETIIEEYRPNILLCHHGGDLNIDHAVCFRAALTAARPLGGSTVSALYTYEVPSATEWAFGALNENFRPQAFVDISETLDLKLDAMEVYESETRLFPHPRSREAISCLATLRGSQAGLQAAEAFQLIRRKGL